MNIREGSGICLHAMCPREIEMHCLSVSMPTQRVTTRPSCHRHSDSVRVWKWSTLSAFYFTHYITDEIITDAAEPRLPPSSLSAASYRGHQSGTTAGGARTTHHTHTPHSKSPRV